MKKIFAAIGWVSILFLCACSQQETAYSDFDRSVNFAAYKTFGWLPSDSSSSNDPVYNNQIVEKNIKSEIERELKKRGYTLDTVNPDLRVKFNLIVEDKLGVISNPVYSNPNPNNQLNPIQPYNPFTSNYGAYNSTNYNPYYNMQSSPYNTNYYANNYPYNGGNGYPVGTISGYSYGYGLPVNYSQGPYIIGNTQQTYQYKQGTIIVDLVERTNRSLIWRGWSSSDITNPSSFENHLDDEVKAIFREYPVK
ncbi:MAG TPA: DUF4136 domain-containing protein [Cytophagaceae bacterium]|nr:DUF4136 domain-containing protein [Cytophagaceae bacterium]